MPIAGERWREIPGYEGYYAASDFGRIKSLKRLTEWENGTRLVVERILKPGTGLRGRRYVTLHLYGVRKTFLVHKLVLLAFVGPCPDGMECCHFNGDPSDNRLGNLRYDTHRANAADMIRHDTQAKGEYHGMAKLTSEKVQEIRARLKNGELQREIAVVYGVTRYAISLIKRGLRWGHVAP